MIARFIRTTLPTALALTIVMGPGGRGETPVSANSPQSAPALPAPSGSVVNVSTEAQLQSAIGSLASNRTIVIAPGTYTLTSTLWINGSYANVTIRGATNNPNDVVLVGQGMGVSSGSVPYGIWTGGGVTGLTVANLTIKNIFQHAVMFNSGTESPRIYNVRLVDAGEQLVKSNPDGAGGGVDNGIVEYSTIEYTNTSPNNYTNGVDVHSGQNWIIRHNLFRRIRAPQGELAGPAILMWNGSGGTIVDGNTFIDCHREISMGLITRSPNDHTGGIVRNNFIYRSADAGGDVGIAVFDSPGTRVVHNTIFLNGQYPSSIEYRFADTTGTSIINNLSDRSAQARDGATGTVQGNVWTAASGWFVAPASGDLHLKSTSLAAINVGTSNGDAAADWDGQARPAGGAPDAGADEVTTTTPPADTTAPSVSVTSPSGGATLSSTATITATASDNVGVAGVRFTIDGVNTGAEDITAPYQLSWNTATVANGTHVVRAVARDAAGNNTTSAAVTITVSNVVADVTKPTVAIASPAAGSAVAGSVIIAATASDNVGVAGVSFKVDGTNVGAEDTTAPYQVSWDAAALPNGPRTITVIARDAAGNTASTTRQVTVQNPGTGVAGDLNGDGYPDLLFSHTTGLLHTWFMQGGALLTARALSPVSANPVWRVASVDDFNGDRKSDLLWQHVTTGQTFLWFMDGTTMIGTSYLAEAPSVWRVAASGDLNADGKTDIVWQHPATGQVYAWLLNGTTVIGEGAIGPFAVDVNWRVAGAADLNKDGKADLVWQNGVTGQLAFAKMNGLAVTEVGSLATGATNPVWRLKAVADFNRDNSADLVWQHAGTSHLYIWYLNGTSLAYDQYLNPPAVNPAWQIVGGK